MTTKQLIFGITALLTIIAVAGISGYVYIKNYEKQAEIARQVEVEKAKIEQAEATKRTKERMKWVPWYSK